MHGGRGQGLDTRNLRGLDSLLRGGDGSGYRMGVDPPVGSDLGAMLAASHARNTAAELMIIQ